MPKRTISGELERRRSGVFERRDCPRKAQHTAIIADKLYREHQLTVKEICDQLSISRGTFYNYLRHRGVLFEDKQN